MHDESKYVIYLGSTIWGFEHACRVANACAWEQRNRIEA